MQERRISKAQVEATIFAPDEWRYGDEGEIIASKRLGRRKVSVVYLSLPEEIRVITVW